MKNKYTYLIAIKKEKREEVQDLHSLLQSRLAGEDLDLELEIYPSGMRGVLLVLTKSDCLELLRGEMGDVLHIEAPESYSPSD